MFSIVSIVNYKLYFLENGISYNFPGYGIKGQRIQRILLSLNPALIFLRVAIPWGRWPLMPCKVAQDGNTVDTGYKVTAYKTKSDIKLSFHSPKVPF